MTTPQILAIVGASLAGAKAAEGARDAGFDGRIVLVGDEDVAPYERPPLSKDILRGEKEVDAASVHAEGFYAEHSIELVTDHAVALDPINRRIELSSGDPIAFDAVRLRDAIRGATRVAVIGAGWIGSEVAASARQMGADVVLIKPAPVPLQRVLGDEIGAVFRQMHAHHGVELRFGTGVSALRGTKTVEAVTLDDGRVESAVVVVVGVGVTPRTELADGARGLRIDNGIVVDQYLETSTPGVYAAGDVANAWHPRYRQHLRVEHWANALNQGTTAGRNAAGGREAYTRLPYFFSDQYDLGLEYVGYGDAGDAVAVRGDLDSREFIAFWHHHGVVTAAMNVNVWDVVDDLKAIVERRVPIDPARLENPDVSLRDLAAGEVTRRGE